MKTEKETDAKPNGAASASSDAIDRPVTERTAKGIAIVGGLLAIAVVLIGWGGSLVSAAAGTVARDEVKTAVVEHSARPHVGAATKESLDRVESKVEGNTKLLQQVLVKVSK